MRAIVHSVHSQVPETIRELRTAPKVIVSMDSHLDVSRGGDDSLYPDELRVIARRTGAHTALVRTDLAFLPDGRSSATSRRRLIAVISEAMLAAHAADIESQLPRNLRIRDQRESISSCVEFLRSEMGIEVHPSPPKPLNDLAVRSERFGNWLLDIDLDYMLETQKECYTSIEAPRPGELQPAAKVLDFIKITLPETITLSEAKVSALRDPRSEASTFIDGLRDAGYAIEERGLFESDAEVVRGIQVCNEFYVTVSRGLMINHIGEMMKGDYREFEKAEESSSRVFFRSRGY